MSGNSSHLGVCTTSLQSQQFQLFAPKLSQELGIDLSKAVQFSRRMKSCKKMFNMWHNIYFILCTLYFILYTLYFILYTLYLPSLVISLPVAALSCDKVGLPTWPLTLNTMAKTNSKWYVWNYSLFTFYIHEFNFSSHKFELKIKWLLKQIIRLTNMHCNMNIHISAKVFLE